MNRFDFIGGEPVHVGIHLGTVSGGNFGNALLICDLGRDGRNELLIGAPAGDAEPPRPGSVSIFHPGQTLLRALVGETPGDEFGDELLCCDLNGDGLDEVVVAAESASPGRKAGAGAVYVFQGRSAQQLRLRGRLNGARAGDHLGDSLACYRVGGGLRGQSHNLLVGAEGVLEAGSYSVFNGLNLGRQFTRPGRSPGEEFGVGLAPCRVTRSRVPVTLVGAEGSNAGAGRAYLYDLSGRLLRALDPPDEFNPGQFGSTVACCDWNGDGVDDLLIAAEGTEEDNGRVYILSGINASLLAILSGPLFA